MLLFTFTVHKNEYTKSVSQKKIVVCKFVKLSEEFIKYFTLLPGKYL